MARPHVRSVLAVVALLLLGAACTSGSNGEAADGAPSPVATGPTGVTGEDGGAAASAVRAVNFAFEPSELEVAAGDTLEVRNAASTTPHTFTVLDTDIDVELGGMGSETITVDLDPGTYAFECRFHPQMTGTLTVT